MSLLEKIEYDYDVKRFLYLCMVRSCGKTELRKRLLKKWGYERYMKEQCKTSGRYAIRFITHDFIRGYKK